MKLIVGLGNPGSEYENTRHNAGFSVIDKIAVNEGFTSWKKEKRFQSLLSQGNIVTEKVILVKPQTFMNLSGEAVLGAAKFYKILPRDIFVIHDDLDLPLAVIRISQNISSGGHRGVQSIIDSLHSQEFIRFRLGISGETRQEFSEDAYVMQKFSAEEKIKMGSAISLVIEAIEHTITLGVLEAMNEFN